MSDSVGTLVASIRKAPGFKRLALYNIQALVKRCTPPSNGWAVNAMEAFETGATEIIGSVVEKNKADTELWLVALIQLSSCAVAGASAGMLANGTLGVVVSAFRSYGGVTATAAEAVRDGWISGGGYRSSGPNAEAVAVTESFVRLLAYVSLQARAEASNPAAGIIPCLLDLLPRLPTPSAVRLALTALESLGRTPEGAAAMSSPEMIPALLAAASTLYGVDTGVEPTGAKGALPRSARVSTMRGTPRGGGPLSPTALGSGLSRRTLAALNGHLEPAFKLLDRLSREEVGLASLQGSAAVHSLALTVEWAQSQVVQAATGTSVSFAASRLSSGLDASVGASGVRVLARVLGNDLGALISRIAEGRAGGASSSTKAAHDGGEADFAASLIASLATDPEVAGRLLAASGGGPILLTRLVRLLDPTSGASLSAKATASLALAVRRLAAHSTEFGTALVGAGAVPLLLSTARAMAAAGGLPTAPSMAALTEALTALAEVLAMPDAGALAASEEGCALFLSLLKERGSAEPAVAAACLAALHSCQINGVDSSSLVSGGLLPATVAAMASTAAADHMETQVAGTLVLTASAMAGGRFDEAGAFALVQAGALPAVVSNLSLSKRAQPGDSAGGCGACFSTGAPSRLLSTSALYVGRPGLATAGGKALQRLSLYAASNAPTENGDVLGAEDGFSAAVDALAGSHPAAPLLAAVTMHLLALICSSPGPGPSAAADAKAAGLVKRMLAAYGRHADSDAVHDAFTDLVDATVGEAELSSAVLSVARDVAALKEALTAGDPALFAIAETELGREGLILPSSAGAAASIGTENGAGDAMPVAPTAPVRATSKAKEATGVLADRINAALCLLQAATVSARLSGALAMQGVPVLVRTLGLVGVAKTRVTSRPGGGGKGGRGRAIVLGTAGGRALEDDPEADRTLFTSTQDEILVHACATLTGLARIALDWRAGTAGLDPVPTSSSNAAGRSVGPRDSAALIVATSAGVGHRRQRSGKSGEAALAAIRSSISIILHRPVVIRMLIKTVNTRANLPATLSAASVALGVLALSAPGGGAAGPSDPTPCLDSLLQFSGVEAMVSGLRAQPGCVPALHAISSALGCVGIVGRALDPATGTLRMPAPAETLGSTAISTRGATRAVLRALETAAASANGSGSRWFGAAGQAALCALLRVLLVTAETTKGADLLRKQGAIDGLIAALDSGSESFADEGEGGTTGSSGNSNAPGKVALAGDEASKGSGGTTVASALSGDLFGGALTAVTGDGSTGSQGRSAASQSSGAEGGAVGQGPEASDLILSILSQLMDSKDLAEAVRTISGTADRFATGGLKLGASTQLAKLALTTVLSLAGKDTGLKAGATLWTDALGAVARLVAAAVQAADAVLADKRGGQEASRARETTGRAAQLLLPPAALCLAAILAFKPRLDLSGAEGGVDLKSSWEVHAGTACTALLACAQIATGGRGGGDAKAAVDRLSAAFFPCLLELLATANALCKREPAAAAISLLCCTPNPTAVPPVASLLRVLAQLEEEGQDTALAVAVELLYTVTKLASADGTTDGLAALLAGPSPPAPVITRVLSELVQATNVSGGASASGAALLLLARLTHRQPAIGNALCADGIADTSRLAVLRFCTSSTVEVDGDGSGPGTAARDVEASGAARVLEGAAQLHAVLIGRAGSSPAADTAALVHLLDVVREEPGGAYINTAPRALTALFDAIAVACTESGEKARGQAAQWVGTDAAGAAREACTAADARRLVVASMSSTRADGRLLKAGARALAALGDGSGSGVALDVRRAVTAFRRAAGLAAATGLLPATDGAAAGSSAEELGPRSPTGTPLGLRTPASAAAGDPAEALAALDASLRNLSAVLAGESSLTPAAYRYAYDTLVSALESGVLAHAAVGSGALSAASPAPATPHHHATSGGGGGSRVSMRISVASAGVGSAPSPDAFATACSALVAAAVRGLSRLTSPSIAPNPSPIDNTRLGSPSAGARPAELAVLMGAEATVTVWDATPEECGRLGDPRGTASYSQCGKLQEAAAAAAPIGWPAFTLPTCPIVAPVATGEVVDALVLALGRVNISVHRPETSISQRMAAVRTVISAVGHIGTPSATSKSSSSSRSPSAASIGTGAPAFAMAGYTVTSEVAEAVSQALAALSLTAAGRTDGSLLCVVKAPRASPTAGGSPAATVPVSGGPDLVWAVCARGLVHLLSTTVEGPAGCSLLLAPAALPHIKEALSVILRLAAQPPVLRTLMLASALLPFAPAPSARCLTASGTPAASTVLLQLLTAAEASSRASPMDLARIAADCGKAESSEDVFASAHGLLGRLGGGGEAGLRTLARRIARPEGAALPGSPAWVLLAALTSTDVTGGAQRLLPSEEDSSSGPVRLSSLSGMRITGELTEALLSGCVEAAGGDASERELIADVLPLAGGGSAVVAPLLAAWAAAFVERSPAALDTTTVAPLPGIIEEGGAAGTLVVASPAATPGVDKALSPLAATANLHRGVSRAVVFATVRVLGHAELCGMPSVGDEVSLSLYRGALRQDGADLLATAGLQVLRRTLGLTAKHSAAASATPALTPPALSQVEALAVGGVFPRILLALALHSTSTLYAREAVRLFDDLGRALARHGSLPGGAYTGPLLKGALGLNAACLKALQSSVKRLGRDRGDELIKVTGGALISALSDVFTSVSGKGFTDALERAVTAVEECRYARIPHDGGSFLYIERAQGQGGNRTVPKATDVHGVADAPEPFARMLMALEALQLISSSLEPEAVPIVSEPMVGRTTEALNAYAQDARIAGILAWGLARVCEHRGNHGAVFGPSASVPALVALVPLHAADEFVAEAVAYALRPLSVSVASVQTLKPLGVVPALVELMRVHVTSLQPARVVEDDGSGGAGAGGAGDSAAAKEARARAHCALMRRLMSPTAASAPAEAVEELAPAQDGEGTPAPPPTAALAPGEPRIVQFCTQALANIACDTQPDAPSGIPGYEQAKQFLDGACSGGVARLVAAGGVQALIASLRANLERPRVLEDALCALSNVAFATDGVRLLIGREAAPLVVSVLRVFNDDPRTFSMALRTVGNLTRCDENILATVSAGVIGGIVEGMARNATDSSVLRLAADVIGNLASVDETAVDSAQGLKQLVQGLRAREGTGSGRSSSADRLATMASLTEAVATLLLDDGAHTGLVAAMAAHATDTSVISACLRSLQYMAETRSLVDRMAGEVGLGKAVCAVMRSGDFDAELCVRGSLVLAQMLRHPAPSLARTSAVDAGASQVLLSALETHRTNVDTVAAILNVVDKTIALEPTTLAAARELDSPATLIETLSVAGVVAVGGASAAAQRASVSPRSPVSSGRWSSGDTLSRITPERAQALLRQGLPVLKQWSTANAELGGRMATAAARMLATSILPPPVDGQRPKLDGALLESGTALLASLVFCSRDAAESLALGGDAMALLTPLPSIPGVFDHAALVDSVLSALGGLAAASPAAALAVLSANGHGIAQGIAAHMALSTGQEESARAMAYAKAGSVVHSLIRESLPARRAAAEAAAAVSANAEVLIAEAGGSPSVRHLVSPDGGRRKRAEVAALTPRSRAEDDKRFAAANAAREKEVAKLAARAKVTPEALLERRAGLVSWSLFPTTFISRLAGGGGEAPPPGVPSPSRGTGEVFAEVWFLPDMVTNASGKAPRVKARKMRLAVSTDLRVLTWSYTSRHYKKVLDWNLPLSSVLTVRPGLPVAPAPGKLRSRPLLASLLGRAPSIARGIVLESDTAPLLHIEAASSQEADLLLRALDLLVQYAKAREGVPEAIPEVPADASAFSAVQDFAGSGVAGGETLDPRADGFHTPRAGEEALPTISVPLSGTGTTPAGSPLKAA